MGENKDDILIICDKLHAAKVFLLCTQTCNLKRDFELIGNLINFAFQVHIVLSGNYHYQHVQTHINSLLMKMSI